jgi:predicted cupin superfamily sugar epimerase
MPTAEEIIRFLQLRPLPLEGGWYRETHRSSFSTAIYYLLTPDTFSALHRLPADEVFHFYLGDPVEMLQLGPTPEEGGRLVTLGPDIFSGQQVQIVVPAGVWQGSRLIPGGRFALLGTTMAPGFEFAQYEAGDRRTLAEAYTDFADRISRL